MYMNNLRFSRVLPVLFAIVLMLTLTACDDDPGEAPVGAAGSTFSDTASSGQRDYRVQPVGNGEDIVTVMLYLCGSDLESEGGAATTDINEILYANISDKVNIIVETGGANSWNNSVMDPGTNQRWQLADGDMRHLEDAGLKNMSKGDTLTDFINFCATDYPADRYMLVLWDHGGGTVDGYAYDERFDSDKMMPLPELDRALANAGVVFDLIGFDSCLMSTAETAFMLEKYADYMVASQRVEPGDGWHYTPWVNALSENTSISTPDLGAAIIDSFIAESRTGYYGKELTLSLTDLTYIQDFFNALYEFFETAQDTLVDDRVFIDTSGTLGRSPAMVDNYDLVDLGLLLQSMSGSGEALAKLEQCVAYNNATIADHNGLCLYFPYMNLDKVGSALDVYRDIGLSDSYRDFIITFANVMVGGQVYSGGGTANPLGGDDYDPDYWTDLDWVDEGQIAGWNDFFAENCYDGSELVINEKGDNFVLSLSDNDWDMITTIYQRVFLDDGEGYIDLGADAMYEFDNDGDLLIDFDNTWVALDGELVCFYTQEDVNDGNTRYTYGVAPVLYNGKDAELVVVWDNDYPEGYVAGWRYTTTGSGSQKGLFEFENGMVFDILCDYYTYDGDYEAQYKWGEIRVNGPLKVSYEDVGDADCMVYYELYDIYCNTYWTESVVYSL